MALPCHLLLHPELLSNDQLINTLVERHLRIPNIQGMHRDDLLELFHQYCVPYGQRKCRDSGRGKVLNNSQPISPEPQNKLNTVQSSQNSRKSHFNNCERLKPPPDILSGHMKRIKLENKFVNTPKDIAVKRKMSVDEVPELCDQIPQKKEKKPITWP